MSSLFDCYAELKENQSNKTRKRMAPGVFFQRKKTLDGGVFGHFDSDSVGERLVDECLKA